MNGFRSVRRIGNVHRISLTEKKKMTKGGHMKKVLIGVFAAAILLAAGAASVFAVGSGYRSNFTDVNGDGVCDHYAARQGRGHHGICHQ